MSETAATPTATLAIGGNSKAEMPILSGSVGPDVVDIRKLYGSTGCFTYDPGFTSTAACRSRITYIDGDEGVLLHRGYRIEDLAEKSDFLEVAYLILFGELPTAAGTWRGTASTFGPRSAPTRIDPTPSSLRLKSSVSSLLSRSTRLHEGWSRCEPPALPGALSGCRFRSSMRSNSARAP